VLVLFLAKMQYQATWILLFVAGSFAIAMLAVKPLTPALREAPFRAPKMEKG